jgi:cell division protein FtsW
MTFQPSEFTKLALIIFFAHWFANEEKNRMGAFFLLIGLIFILILLQPDMGTAIIIVATSFVMFFSSKTTLIKKIFMMVPVILLLLLAVIAMSPYRSQRLFSFLNVEKEKYGSSYHANQALMSIGSGGIFGVGIGKSTQKFSYLPESNTDSIFGIIAEETGFFGCLLVFTAFLVIFCQAYLIMKKTKDLFGKFLSFGIGLFIVLQTFLNLSSMLSLTPLTGVPLPFVSSGGSALLVQFAAIGILLNIGKSMK